MVERSTAVRWFALIWAAIGAFTFFAPLRWHGTSIALSIALGIAILALTIPVFRFGRRLNRIALIARPDGVTILGPRDNQPQMGRDPRVHPWRGHQSGLSRRRNAGRRR